MSSILNGTWHVFYRFRFPSVLSEGRRTLGDLWTDITYKVTGLSDKHIWRLHWSTNERQTFCEKTASLLLVVMQLPKWSCVHIRSNPMGFCCFLSSISSFRSLKDTEAYGHAHCAHTVALFAQATLCYISKRVKNGR